MVESCFRAGMAQRQEEMKISRVAVWKLRKGRKRTVKYFEVPGSLGWKMRDEMR